MKHVAYTLLAVTALSFPLSQAMAQTSGSMSGNTGTNPGSSMSGEVGVNTGDSNSAGANTDVNTNNANTGGAAGNSGSTGSVYATSNLDTDTVRSIQQSLNDRGYRIGEIDGRWGNATAAELRRFEQNQGLSTSSGTSLNAETLQHLGIGLDTITPSAGATGGVNGHVTGTSSR